MRAALGHEARHLRIAAKARHVIDEPGARVQRGRSDGGLRGVDRDLRGGVARHQALDHRQHPRVLLGARHGLGPGAYGFAADVEQVGSFGKQLLAVGDRRLGAQVAPAVGE